MWLCTWLSNQLINVLLLFALHQLTEQFPDVNAQVIADAVLTVTKSVFRKNILEKAQR